MHELTQRTLAVPILIVVACSFVVGSATGCRFLPSRRASVSSQPQQYQYQHHRRIAPAPADVLVSQYYQQLKPRRIVIAIPTSRTHLLPEQKTFALALADSLRRCGFADAVVAPPCACDSQAIRKGKFDLQQLVDLSSTFSGDAVLYCDVVSFSAYEPLEVAISMRLVDARESIAIMAVDGHWDLRDAQTQSSYLNYLSSNPTDNDFQAGIKFQSPTEFLNFVSADVAKLMLAQ
jgi:hypothetical protein